MCRRASNNVKELKTKTDEPKSGEDSVQGGAKSSKAVPREEGDRLFWQRYVSYSAEYYRTVFFMKINLTRRRIDSVHGSLHLWRIPKSKKLV